MRIIEPNFSLQTDAIRAAESCVRQLESRLPEKEGKLQMIVPTTASTRSRRLVYIAIAVLLGSSCSDASKKTYVWTRQEPALGRRSSTAFEVRLTINMSSGTVAWLEEVRDSDGYIGRNLKTYSGCTVFD